MPCNPYRIEYSPETIVSPNWYINDYQQKKSNKLNVAPFLTSSARNTDNHRSTDLKISPAEYYPLYRKHRVKLGNSLQYTEVRDPLPLPYYLRRATVDKFIGTEKPSHIRFANRQYQPQRKSNKPIYKSKPTRREPEKVIKIHYVLDEMVFTDIHEFDLINDEFIVKQQKPCLLNEKLKWTTANTFPKHRLKDLINITKFEQPKQINDRLLPRKHITEPKVKKNITMEKMIVPGPGHYNLPSLFDPKPTYEDLLYCCNPNRKLKQKSAPRYLDSLVEKTRREDIPGPGNYATQKSSIDFAAQQSKRYVQPNLARERISTHKLAPNYYNINYELTHVSNPSWSMKTSNRFKLNRNVISIGPTTYNVENGNISYKIEDRQNIRPFNSTT